MAHVFDFSASDVPFQGSAGTMFATFSQFGQLTTNLFWSGPELQTFSYGSGVSRDSATVALVEPERFNVVNLDVQPIPSGFYRADRFRAEEPADLLNAQGVLSFVTVSPQSIGETAYLAFQGAAPLSASLGSVSGPYAESTDAIEVFAQRTATLEADATQAIRNLQDQPLSFLGTIDAKHWSLQDLDAALALTFTPDPAGQTVFGDLLDRDVIETYRQVSFDQQSDTFHPDDDVSIVLTDHDDSWSSFGFQGSTLSIDGGDGDDNIQLDEIDSQTHMPQNAVFSGEDGNDYLFARATQSVTFDGGSGNDTLAAAVSHVATSDVTATLTGGDGNDELRSFAGAQFEIRADLYGGAGNDTLYGDMSGGDLIGGPGDDVMQTGFVPISQLESLISTAATLYDGGAGNDRMLAGNGADTLLAGSGDDFLRGLGGDDLIVGGDGADTYSLFTDDTPLGNDTIADNGGMIQSVRYFNWLRDGLDLVVTLDAPDAQVTLQGFYLTDADDWSFYAISRDGSFLTVADPWDLDVARSLAPFGATVGTDKADTLAGSADADRIIGDAGDDLIFAGVGADYLLGEDGADTIYGGSEADTLDGGAGADLLGGSQGDDVLLGQGGRDTLWAADGDDSLNGGAEDDLLGAGAGADTLRGGDGADALWTSFGHDYAEGGTGADTLGGFWGNDTLLGEAGDDVLWGAFGRDQLSGGDGADNLGGGTEADTVMGGAGADTLSGAAGDDLLTGGDDADLLFGASGQDTLEGGAGDDTLYGGADADLFVFGAGFGADVLFGLTEGADRLAFDRALLGGQDLDGAGIVSTFGSVSGGDYVLDFGTEGRVTLNGAAAVSDLGSMIDVIG